MHQANAGHGPALLTAYRKALSLGCDWIFHVDSDDQFLTADFWKLWDRRSVLPYLAGFRAARGDGPHRRLISRGLALLDWALFGVRIRDANIPFRLLRADLLEELLAEIPPDVYSPNVFIAVLAASAGVDLCETPVAHKDRATGTPMMNTWVKLLKVSLRCARELNSFRRDLGPAAERVKAHG